MLLILWLFERDDIFGRHRPNQIDGTKLWRTTTAWYRRRSHSFLYSRGFIAVISCPTAVLFAVKIVRFR